MSERTKSAVARHPTRTAAYRRFLGLLVAAREHAGLSQETAAAALGIPLAELARMEAGSRRIDVIETAAFCRLYGKSLAYFASEAPDEPTQRGRARTRGAGA